MGAALHYAADMAELEQVTERGRSYWSVTGGPAGRTETLTLTRDGQDEAWDSASLFSDQEEAEAGLLRPECYFIPDRNGECVRAAPLHQYARSTTRVRPEVLPTGLLAATLGAHPDDLILDHALLQKRCTHTWSFPPERIALARPVPTLLSNAGTRRVSLLAA